MSMRDSDYPQAWRRRVSGMVRYVLLVLLGFALAAGPSSRAPADDIIHQRALYRQALAALKAENFASFDALARQLEDYPLHAYLQYKRLRQQLAETPDRQVQQFLDRQADTPLAYSLRGAWLHRLADQGRWRRFLKAYDQRPGVALHCYDLRARIRAGSLRGVAGEARQIWLHGSSRPDTCDRLFAWMTDTGRLTPHLIWQRIALAMTANRLALARYLADQLPEEDRQWAALWREVHRHPADHLDAPPLRKDTARTRRIVADGIKQLILQDVAQGRAVWEQLRPHYQLNSAMRDRIERTIALYAAFRYLPMAFDWLDALRSTATDEDTRLWKARTALRNGNWQGLISSIEALDDSQRQENQWQYWLARARLEIGDIQSGEALLRQLAQQRSYYGFLAADRLHVDYTLANQPLHVEQQRLARLKQRPGIRRARELYDLGEYYDARREWNWVIAGLDREGLKAAALLAHRWGWHANAIRTVTKTGDFDDLALRFPVPYRAQIDKTALVNRLAPAWIYGVMRRESAFKRHARSYAGARGLMQLMPATARHIADKREWPRPTAADLFDTGQNIRLGGAYMRYLLDRYDNNQLLATAAYNAGPEHVHAWLPKDRALAPDQWVDTLPFPETRRYIRAVMAYSSIFARKLDEQGTRMSSRMPIVYPQASNSRASAGAAE